MNKQTVVIIAILVILGLALGGYFLLYSGCVSGAQELKSGQRCCLGLEPEGSKLGKMFCVPPGVIID